MIKLEYKYLKEIINNSTLGSLLPVNFNPFKVCSFNCVFCSLGPTTKLSMERELFYPPEEIFSEIEDFIKNNGEPNYIWLTGDGEPALYLGFKNLASRIMLEYPKIKIRASSNGSLLHREDVRDEFLLCDLITVNLNTLSPEECLRISRHHKDVKLDKVIQGIKLLRQEFNGKFWIATVFVKGINDHKLNVQNLKSLLLEINPDLYLVRGFSESKNNSLSEDFIKYVKEEFQDVNFQIEFSI
ncbi:MAG: radical SAM protein [Candidatus Hodarchaeota archaeon]